MYVLLDDDAAIGAAAEALIAGNAPVYRGLVEELVSGIPGGWCGFSSKTRPSVTFLPHLDEVIDAVISRALQLRMGRDPKALRSTPLPMFD